MGITVNYKWGLAFEAEQVSEALRLQAEHMETMAEDEFADLLREAAEMLQDTPPQQSEKWAQIPRELAELAAKKLDGDPNDWYSVLREIAEVAGTYNPPAPEGE